MKDEQLAPIVKAVAAEWQAGGLGLDTMYGEFAMEVARRAVAAERERCKRIVQLNQYRNGYHTHEHTTMGHYDVNMFAEIDAGMPPRA